METHNLIPQKWTQHTALPFRRGCVTVSEEKTPWNGDLLSFSEYGRSFTNLVQSIDTTKVISIEGGFGQGKTFFRQCWAKELRAAGEVVIEIDAQQSDHSGDPVITFIGALVAAAPPKDKSRVEALGRKVLGVGGRCHITGHHCLRSTAWWRQIPKEWNGIPKLKPTNFCK